MKHRVLSLGLGLSLLFNLAVVVGFMLGVAGPEGPRGMTAGASDGPSGGPGEGRGGPRGPKPPLGAALDFDRAARILELSETQRATLAEIKAERDRIFPAIDEDSQLLEHDLREELEAEQADSAVVRQILERQAQLSRDRRMAQADLFERFQQMLTPEQRHRLHDALTKRPPHPQRPPEVIARFDRDGDGRLNPEERAAADQELRNRRALHGPRGGRLEGRPEGAGDAPADRPGLPPLAPFFDRDEDGTLNDAERAERDEFIRTHKPSRAFRPEGRSEPRGGRGGDRPADSPRP
jgi:Spy/CpxP family protein refolding chaperone